MAPADISLAPLAQALEAWLRDVPKASDALLVQSGSLLQTTGTGSPAWLALQNVSFRWTLHSEFDEVEPSWLFGSRVSAREMLDAELQVDLRPSPFEEPPPFVLPSEASVSVMMPAAVMAPGSEAAPGERVPPDAEPERTLLLRLGPDETLGIWSPSRRKKQPDVDADEIRARWMRAGVSQDIDGNGPWPFELLLGLTGAFTAPRVGPPGSGLRFDALFTVRPVWKLASEAIDASGTMQIWLDASSRAKLEPPLSFLRSRWDVSRRAFHLRALVDRTGQLAPPEDADTFLAPFRLEWDANGTPSVAVELPDLVMTGELRGELLAKFAQSSEMDEVAGEMNRALGERLVTADDVRAWCAADREGAMVLRVSRAERHDHHLLVLTAAVRGEPVIALVDSEKTRLDIVDGRWTATLDKKSLGYVGRLRAAGMGRRNGAEGFREFLSSLLRWRLLFP